jgi:histidyl-tRNA synthetase
MPDILPDENLAFDAIRGTFTSITDLYGFRDVETPIVEPAELFTRSLGGSSDVVGKEMYSFDERGAAVGSSAQKLALRPEGTAGVVRALVCAVGSG